MQFKTIVLTNFVVDCNLQLQAWAAPFGMRRFFSSAQDFALFWYSSIASFQYQEYEYGLLGTTAVLEGLDGGWQMSVVS